MKQNTFHPLTATFISAILQTLPSYISTRDMQYWIEHPSALKNALLRTLSSEMIIHHENDKKNKGRLLMRITKDGEAPFHQQTAKFIAVVVQNIPEIRNERMEFWHQHLNTLKKELEKTLIINIY